MGDITMRQVILNVRTHESTVIRNDVGNAPCESTDARVKSDQGLVPPRRMRSTAPRWFAAALAVTCCPDVPRSGVAARPNGIASNSLQFAQARTNRANDAGPAGQNSNA